MASLTRTYPIDTALQLEDGAAAISTTEVNSGGILDLGADSVMLGAFVLQVTAIDAGNSDESYHVELQGASTSDFSDATTQKVLASIHLGAHEATGAVPGDTGADDTTGVYYVPFTNDVAGTTYRYVRLKVTVAGTSPSITYTAFLTQQRTMGN